MIKSHVVHASSAQVACIFLVCKVSLRLHLEFLVHTMDILFELLHHMLLSLAHFLFFIVEGLNPCAHFRRSLSFVFCLVIEAIDFVLGVGELLFGAAGGLQGEIAHVFHRKLANFARLTQLSDPLVEYLVFFSGNLSI